MTIEQVVELVRSQSGVLVLAPAVGSEAPQIAWGDFFFYYAPDGQVPQHGQPFATIITKDYPDDARSRLDPADRWRRNIHVGRAALVELAGAGPHDPAAADVFQPHPVYAPPGWIAVVNPGERTMPTLRDLLVTAHADAGRRALRRPARRPGE
ncbi:DUF6194 family protein [Cryobacterium sp.]|jgi:hypothetical protein|uniref:DUF6194 family protein n=1 Tax=Cryobacterium sp. TaxID=1926290 RepID=UPI002627E89D|nr:DUF6194 family protein [Cryobacterium sp.]MCU1447219.1 hypothetical protein [Cryobacterium sp.]